MSEPTIIQALSDGANPKRVRDHNERLILSVLQRHGALAGMEIARRTHLSAQTISVILRKLESDGLLTRRDPIKGKIGKPSVPLALNPEGALSIGFKLGRRSSEVFLTNLCGEVLKKYKTTYDVAKPLPIFGFMQDSLDRIEREIGPQRAAKLCGIGIAIPFEIWQWQEVDGASDEEFMSWQNIDFSTEIKAFTDLPVFMINDATSACWAEHVYGRGREFTDYAYFFIASFIGGGIVIHQNVHEGTRGNAGALGSLSADDPKGVRRQLVDVASIHLLEKQLITAGMDAQVLWREPQDWSLLEPHVSRWIDNTARALAKACLSICAVIDFEAILIDGAFPTDVRARLVTEILRYMAHEDARGLILPRIEQGQIGAAARAIGAACGPIYAQYFLGSKARAI